MRLFCDLDGVLADFDGHYCRTYGEPADQTTLRAGGRVVWERITPDFYAQVPPMPDAAVLWARIKHLDPLILTGINARAPNLRYQKRSWVDRVLGPRVQVICCETHNKRDYARPGDLIIDDRPQFRQLWEQVGGVWITHIDARSTLRELERMGVI